MNVLPVGWVVAPGVPCVEPRLLPVSSHRLQNACYDVLYNILYVLVRENPVTEK